MVSARMLLPLGIGVAVLFVVLGTGQAHDHTRKTFQRKRAELAARERQQAEAAPQTKVGQKACRLALELSWKDRQEPVAGLVRITNQSTGKPLALSGEIQRDAFWYAISPGAKLDVPPTKLTVEALVGLHAERVVHQIDLTGKSDSVLQLQLQSFYDPADHGLVAGNTHLHLMKLTHDEAFRYLRVVPQADALDLVFVSHLKRTPEDRDYVTNSFTDGDLGRLSRAGVLFGNGEEHRHNFGPGGEGYGHVMLLNLLRLIEPVSIGPGIMKSGTDGIPLQRGIKLARDDDATVIWCHNTFGHEDIPNWVAGLVHAQNIHDGGAHGSYEDSFYRYLNVGMRVPFSTGTDWFIYDFNRVYVPVEGELTTRKWLSSLAAGKSFITNGPFLEFRCQGRSLGDSIEATQGQELHVTGRGIGRAGFPRLELIHNGAVVHAVDARSEGAYHKAELDFRWKVSEPGWIALRVPAGGKNEFDRPIFAHTSPIYVTMDGKSLFRTDAARDLLAEMERSRDYVADKGLFANEKERDAVLDVYRESMVLLKRRMEP